ncbi:MAG: LysM peptidoglycan-binding domain-containing protein [Bacillota bacterium]
MIDYVVQKGDTLDKIAEMFKTSTQTIRELNRLTKAKIRPGLILSIPSLHLEDLQRDEDEED